MEQLDLKIKEKGKKKEKKEKKKKKKNTFFLISIPDSIVWL